MDETRYLTAEEIEHLEFFFEYSQNVVGSLLRAPIRISHAVGDLTVHLYIEDNKVKKEEK